MTQSIRHTPELTRILGLPRRRVKDFDHTFYAKELTKLLKTPEGAWTLRPAQALALHDIGVYGGAFCILGVGQGKTLLTLLAPYVLNARKPMLILPAGLVEKTRRDRDLYAQHWRVPNSLRLYSYELLGRVQSANELHIYQPDLLILDEGHKSKNRRAAVTRRLIRYLNDFPDTKVVVLSGTIMRKSLMDFAHLLRWCLKGNSPIPRTVEECEEWALALDEKVSEEARYEPGALTKLCSIEDFTNAESETQAARRGFQRRLLETPGVVSLIDDGEVIDAGLKISACVYDMKPVTEQHFKKLRETWTTPDDWPLSQPVDIWRHAKELALGLHYIWDPRPPEAWRNARRDWAAFVREILSRSRTLDSELQVANACDEGKLDATALNAWRVIRDTFRPNTVAVWHDESAIQQCLEWMKKPGIVWTEHSLFAERLAKASGCRYYGAKGLAGDKSFIDDASPKDCVIASIDANREGRNLQTKWHRNLFVGVPDGADVIEQAIGRTHRPGQLAEEVTVEFLVGCKEHLNAWRVALSDAASVRDTTGADSKLLLAEIEWPSDSIIASFTGRRWV